MATMAATVAISGGSMSYASARGHVQSHTTAASTPHSSAVTISFTDWDPNQLKIIDLPVIAAFEKANPNIKVNAAQVPYAEYFTKLETGLVSGTAPDVFTMIPNFIDQFEVNHALLNLTPYITKAKINMAAYAPFAVANCSAGGHVYGMPWTVDTIGMYYNATDLAKAGFKSYPTNLTWAPNGSGTLVPFLEKLTVDANGKNATQPGFDPTKIVQYALALSPDSTQTFADVYMEENGGGYQTTGPGGAPTVDSPQNVATYQFIWDLMYKYHVSPPGATVIAPNAGAEENQFLSGKTALLQGGDWLITPISAGAKFKWGVGPLPSGPKGRMGTINAGCSSIPANDKNTQAAVALTLFGSSAQAQTIQASTGGWQPAMLSKSYLYVDAWKKRGVNATPLTPAAQGKLIALPSGVNITAVQTATDDAVADIYLNTSTVPAALKAAQTAAVAAYHSNT
jgi:multiple sugar transport system substrate-binding protein